VSNCALKGSQSGLGSGIAKNRKEFDSETIVDIIESQVETFRFKKTLAYLLGDGIVAQISEALKKSPAGTPIRQHG